MILKEIIIGKKGDRIHGFLFQGKGYYLMYEGEATDDLSEESLLSLAENYNKEHFLEDNSYIYIMLYRKGWFMLGRQYMKKGSNFIWINGFRG